MMANKTHIKAVIETNVKAQVTAWAELEGRSERVQVGMLLKKLCRLRETHNEDLKRLGLVDGLAVN